MNRISAAEHVNTDVTSLAAYLREIGGNRILTRAEERNLFDRIGRGDNRAYHELITSNLKFVVSVCRQFQNQGLPMTDLISEGNLGLIRAARCFDRSHECRFISYAVWWIRQRILRALAEQSRFLSIPVGKAAAMRRIVAAENVLAQRNSRPATADEVAGYLSLREKEVLDLLQMGQYSLGLNEPSGYDEDGAGGDWLVDGAGESPDQVTVRDNLKQEVWDALEDLKEVEREVVRLHYGLGASRPMNLKAISAQLGLPRAWIGKIREDAMNRLR